MSEPPKRMGCLTQKDGKQVTVIKNWKFEKALKAKSTQVLAQYKVTYYEWDMDVAFLFNYEGQHYSLKVGKGLELVRHAEEDLPKNLDKEYRFRWKGEDGDVWRRLEHEKDDKKVKLLCCDENGKIVLMDKIVLNDKLKERHGINYLFNIKD